MSSIAYFVSNSNGAQNRALVAQYISASWKLNSHGRPHTQILAITFGSSPFWI